MEYRELPHGDEAISVIAWVRPSSAHRRKQTSSRRVQYALDKPGVLTVLGGPGLEDNNRI